MTVASGGFVGAAHPEALSAAIERRFFASGTPNGLTLVYAAGQGDGKTRGLNHLAHEGLVKHVIGGHWGLVPRMGRLAIDEKIAAHCFPQGVICQLFRDIAAGRPGSITHVGLDTFVDPLHDGGRLNRTTPEGWVERISLGGKDWLWYKAFPIHVGMIRATVADPHGNLSMEDEAIVGEVLPIAQAAHNCGGIVIAQVKRLSDKPLSPHQVKVPGILVDRIVVSEGDEHDQTFGEVFNPAFTLASPDDTSIDWPSPLPLDARRIVAGRACDEIPHEAIANLGIGMPEGIARIAAERGWLNRFTLTVESGPIGGMPVGGLSFGASFHPQAIVDQPAQFDMYDGRALDIAVRCGTNRCRGECKRLTIRAQGGWYWGLCQHHPDRASSSSVVRLPQAIYRSAWKKESCASWPKGVRASSCRRSNIAPLVRDVPAKWDKKFCMLPSGRCFH